MVWIVYDEKINNGQEEKLLCLCASADGWWWLLVRVCCPSKKWRGNQWINPESARCRESSLSSFMNGHFCSSNPRLRLTPSHRSIKGWSPSETLQVLIHSYIMSRWLSSLVHFRSSIISIVNHQAVDNEELGRTTTGITVSPFAP